MTDERLRTRLRGLFLAGVDMDVTIATARYLQSVDPAAPERVEAHLLPEVRRALETGLVVTYARPFTSPKHLERASDLSQELKVMHEEIIKRRNTVHAHTGGSATTSELRQIVELREPADLRALLEQWSRLGSVSEEWSDLNYWGLRDVEELARVHLGKVMAGIKKLAARVRNNDA